MHQHDTCLLVVDPNQAFCHAWKHSSFGSYIILHDYMLLEGPYCIFWFQMLKQITAWSCCHQSGLDAKLHIFLAINVAGWFAKDPNTLRRVGHVMLQVPYTIQRNPRSIIIADDCFHLLNTSADRVSQAVVKSVEKLFGSKFV